MAKAFQHKGLIAREDTAVIVYDLDYLAERIEEVKKCFPPHALHAIAIKANPLVKLLNRCKDLGVGAEAASLPELHIARHVFQSPEKIVFDSPVKTIEELEYALAFGCHINADSLEELGRIDGILRRQGDRPRGSIGIRINPQVGTGAILMSSVAGEYSKFGVPIRTNRERLIECFVRYQWMTGVHVHIGSQGCPVELLLDGIDVIMKFVDDVNARLGAAPNGRRIKMIDIGGGFPVSYHSDREPDEMARYAKQMRERHPLLFSSEYKLVTEFGRYIHANAGWVVSRVEYVKREPGINTAMVHVGADLLLRECYRPEDWPHEMFVVDPKGTIKSGADDNPYMIAGPLCFAGDIIARGVRLPIIEPGDYIIVQDAGAYALSMWSRYNSRQVPKVIGCVRDGSEFSILKDREDISDIIDFWS